MSQYMNNYMGIDIVMLNGNFDVIVSAVGYLDPPG